MLTPQVFQFISDLTKNNNKDWFHANKPSYDEARKTVLSFVDFGTQTLAKTDVLEKSHLYRIYRDVRFSKDKTPYKNRFSGHFVRAGASRRGGYFFSFEEDKTYIGGGFYAPEKEDLLRIRKEFEMDATPMREILANAKFKKYFKEMEGAELKTAPRGFAKDDPAIDLLRKKQFYAFRTFTTDEVLADSFGKEVEKTFLALRPFFDYFSEILTTNLNGESIID